MRISKKAKRGILKAEEVEKVKNCYKLIYCYTIIHSYHSKIFTDKIVKTYQVKSLGLLCANNIWKFFNYNFSRYTKLKIDACKILDDKNIANTDETIYNKIIKDSEKKLKWLNMFKTGHVPIEILEEEYGDSEIFYLERRHRLNNASEDVLDPDRDLLRSIDDLVEKVSE